MANRDYLTETRINEGKVEEITTYPYPAEFHDIQRHMWAMNPGIAITAYLHITGCSTRTAIKAVRHACRNIPGYCGDCGKKSTSRFPGNCPNPVHNQANQDIDRYLGSIR